MPHLQVENNTAMTKFPNNFVEMKWSVTFLITFLWKNKRLPGIKIFLIKVILSALLTFTREQNLLTSFLLPNNFFMSSEITGKLLAGRLLIKVTEFPIFELTLSPVFDCNKSNSENFTFDLCELKAVLLDGKTKEDRLKGVGTESCESECFVVVVDEEYEEEDKKHITFLLTLVSKEMIDLGNAKLSMPIFSK